VLREKVLFPNIFRKAGVFEGANRALDKRHTCNILDEPVFIAWLPVRFAQFYLTKEGNLSQARYLLSHKKLHFLYKKITLKNGA